MTYFVAVKARGMKLQDLAGILDLSGTALSKRIHGARPGRSGKRNRLAQCWA